MSGPSEMYFATVNKLIPEYDAQAAYRMGIISSLAFNEGLDPDEQLLRSAAVATDIEACRVILHRWKLRNGYGRAE